MNYNTLLLLRLTTISPFDKQKMKNVSWINIFSILHFFIISSVSVEKNMKYSLLINETNVHGILILDSQIFPKSSCIPSLLHHSLHRKN